MDLKELEERGVIILENEPKHPEGKTHYKAILQRKVATEKWEENYEGAYVLKIIANYHGTWSLTPGQWFLDTLLGFDRMGSAHIDDKIYIDYGAKWYVTNMINVLKEAEAKAYGELNEEEQQRYSGYVHNPSDMRNWYQKPEAKGIKAKKVSDVLKKKKPGKKILEKIQNLEDEITDLKNYLRVLRSNERMKEMEREEHDADVQNSYGWEVLDILNSGLSQKEKIKSIEEWNLQQDEKVKEVRNPESLVRDHEYYWSEKESEEIEKMEKEIEGKEKELEEFESQYDLY